MIPRASGFFRRDVTLGAGLLILLVSGVLLLAEWRDYGQSLESGRNRAQTLSELIAAQTGTTVVAFDRTLRAISRTVQSAGIGENGRQLLARLANQEAREQPGARAVLVVGADGSLLADSESNPPRALNFAAHPFFLRNRDSVEGEISIDIESDGPPAVILSRRLIGADGGFVGVAAVLLNPADFLSLYAGASRLAGSEILLLKPDGTLIARQPRLPDSRSEPIGSRLPIEELSEAARNGSTVERDEHAKVLGMTRLDRLPLVVVVGARRDRLLAHWQDTLVLDGLVALIALVAVIAGTMGLRGYLTRQDEMRQELAARELTLSATNEHLAAALAHTNHGTLMFSRDQRLLLCNRRYLELMQLPDGALKHNMTFDETIEVLRQNGSYSAHALAEMTANRRTALATKETRSYFEHLADGTIIEVRSDPIRDGGLLLTVTDMTASVASAEALRAAKEEAERASDAKSDFIAHVSHDLRTPLTAIIGFSDALSGGYFGPLPPKQKEYIDTIGISAQHLLALINNLLDIAKIEAGRYELEQEEIDLADMVERSLRMVQLRADQQGIAIENKIGETWVVADANAMQQMLLNLLSNAVKFTPGGGVVRLATAPTPDGGLDVTVRDSGVGIPPEYRDQVMLPYMRVMGSRRAEGTGLGLPLAKALIELHGGSILLESELGHGTAVTLRFPPERVLAAAVPSLES
jgi:signal transduction histidine kinase